MKFIKANLFLLITVAVALGGGAALYFLADSAAADLDKSVETRVSLDQRVTGLIPAAVNQKCIDAMRERNAQARLERREKVSGLLKKNSEAYSVLTLDAQGKKLKAFPYDQKQYDQLTLWNQFPQEYEKALMTLLDKVKPTDAPSEDERKDELSRVRDPNVQTGYAPGMAAMPAVSHAAGFGPAGPMSPGIAAPMSPGIASPAGPSPFVAPQAAVTASQPVEVASPAEKALRRLVWIKSQQGWTYADKSSLFVAMSLPSPDYKPEDYWTAQVSLWVQQDILDAIQKTNQAAHEAVEGVRTSAATEEKAKDVGVCVSPVKRLMNANFRGYVVKAGGARAAAPGSAEAAGPTLQYVRTLATRTETAPPALTGRACNDLYDVVQYDFTVVISPLYLRQLYRNLRQCNFHTVLDVEISGVTDVRDASVLNAGKEDSDALYYYGTDAVVKAKITGEMLMMTGWTRGRWDESAKNWDANYPPLMPVQMMQHLAEYDPSCLRKVDTDRITASGGSVGPAPAGAPAAPAAPAASPMANPSAGAGLTD